MQWCLCVWAGGALPNWPASDASLAQQLHGNAKESRKKKQKPATCQPQDDDDFLSKPWENGRTLHDVTKIWNKEMEANFIT